MTFRIEDSDNTVAVAIENQLLASLQASLKQAENQSIVLALRDHNDTLAGGLTASTSYSWLLIKTLWVDQAHRGKGLGRSLMNRAEAKGRSTGCHSAWLDTSNPTAKIFYSRLGYAEFGKLCNTPQQHPPSHCRWFMQKSLTHK